MPVQSWTTTHEDFKRAFNGILMQAKSMGVDTNDKGINEFLQHQAEVLASHRAETRFYTNALNKSTGEE